MKKRQRMLDLFLSMLMSDNKPDSEQVVDFDQDAPMIRSAFMQQYGIDLDACRGELSWFAFIELLSAVTPDTLLGRVIEIRTTKVPPANKSNKEYRKALIEQKAKYAIRKKARGADQMDAMWSQIAEMLMKQAKAGD